MARCQTNAVILHASNQRGAARAVNPASTGPPVIRTPDQRLRVFVSSTLGELSRRAARRRCGHLGARAHAGDVRAGRAAAPSARPVSGLPGAERHLRRPLLAELRADPARAEISGLEEEFELSQDLPRLLYTKVPAPDREPGLEHLMARDPCRRPPTASSRPPMSWRGCFATTSRPCSASGSPPGVPRRLVRARRAGALAPLPAGTTSLIGRERDIDEVVAPHRDARRPARDIDGARRSRQDQARGGGWRACCAIASVPAPPSSPLEAVTEPDSVLTAIAPRRRRRACEAGFSAAGDHRTARRRPLAVDPRQPRAGLGRRTSPRRAAGSVPGRLDPGHEPAGAPAAGRAGVRRSARCRFPTTPRCRSRTWRRRPRWRCSSTAPGPCATTSPSRRQRRRGGRDLPSPRGPAPGYRAGGSARPAARTRRALVSGGDLA